MQSDGRAQILDATALRLSPRAAGDDIPHDVRLSSQRSFGRASERNDDARADYRTAVPFLNASMTACAMPGAARLPVRRHEVTKKNPRTVCTTTRYGIVKTPSATNATGRCQIP